MTCFVVAVPRCKLQRQARTRDPRRTAVPGGRGLANGGPFAPLIATNRIYHPPVDAPSVGPYSFTRQLCTEHMNTSGTQQIATPVRARHVTHWRACSCHS